MLRLPRPKGMNSIVNSKVHMILKKQLVFVSSTPLYSGPNGGRIFLMPTPPLPPPVWNFRAVIRFHLSICSLIFLPSLVILFLLLAQFPAYFPEICWVFFIQIEIGFFVLPLFLAVVGVFLASRR